ncbi:MAG: acyl carrier protein [Bradymonadia bacterium]|jgi:acyl carrier protein
MTQDQVFEKVQAAFIEALDLDEDEVTADAKIFDDLGAESLDLLEIVFLLERAFDVKIPRGGVQEATQEGLDPTDYEVDGVLTPKALAKLAEVMPEVPAGELKPGLTANEIPRLFRVKTFQNIVVNLLAEKGVTVD